MNSLLSRVRFISSVSDGVTVIRCELDSHADTCAFGKHCWVLATYSETLNVSGFDPSLGSIPNVKLATRTPLNCTKNKYDGCVLDNLGEYEWITWNMLL